MTKEAFLEELLTQGHKAWEEAYGKQATAIHPHANRIDVTVFLGRVEKQTGQPVRPTFGLHIRH